MRIAWLLTLTLAACGSGGGGSNVDARPAGSTCGGIANLQCGGEQYCDFPDDSCGTNDMAGVCVDRPDVCAPDQTVCGCDGISYPSTCEAHGAGTDVHKGVTCALR
jgi:hypothetical protein